MQSFAPDHTNKMFTYDDLFEFIKKNTALQDAVDKVDVTAEGPDTLLNAIKKGDGHADIFHHDDCDIYLLKLFQVGKIKPGEFITAYDYLMANWNYLNTSTGVKFKIQLHRLVDEKSEHLSEEGEKYVACICDRYKKILNVTIDREALIKKILALNPIEQCVIYLESNYRSSQKYTLLKETADILPSVGIKQGDKTKIVKPGNFMEPPEEISIQEEYLSFPSYPLQQYLSEMSFDQPMQAAPRFGRIGNETLWKMHKEGKHFYAMYNRHVKSNLMSAHGYKEGPFSIAKHDEGHAVLGSLLSGDKRKIILEKHVPSLMEYLKELKDTFGEPTYGSRLEKLTSTLKNITYDQLNDLTLYPLFVYKALSQQDRLEKFIAEKVFEKLHTYSHKITGCLDTDLAYVLLLLKHRNKNTDLWDIVVKNKKSLVDDPVIQAIDVITKAVANPSDNSSLKFDATMNIKWDIWEKILLEEKQDSKSIWSKIEELNLGADLIQLITKAGLVYYHPFAPLTADKHEALLKFIQTNSPIKHVQIQTAPTASLGIFTATKADNIQEVEPSKSGKLSYDK